MLKHRWRNHGQQFLHRRSHRRKLQIHIRSLADSIPPQSSVQSQMHVIDPQIGVAQHDLHAVPVKPDSSLQAQGHPPGQSAALLPQEEIPAGKIQISGGTPDSGTHLQTGVQPSDHGVDIIGPVVEDDVRVTDSQGPQDNGIGPESAGGIRIHGHGILRWRDEVPVGPSVSVPPGIDAGAVQKDTVDNQPVVPQIGEGVHSHPAAGKPQEGVAVRHGTVSSGSVG